MKEFDKKGGPSREGFSKFLPSSMSDSSTRRRLTEYEIQVQDLQAYVASLEKETLHLRKKLDDTPKEFMVIENKLREANRQLVQAFNQNEKLVNALYEAREQITSLSSITGKPLDITAVLVTIAKHLYPLIARRREHPFASILREYDKHHALRGRQIGVTVNGEHPSLITGRCEGLDSVGRLLVRHGHTLHRVVAGQVQMR